MEENKEVEEQFQKAVEFVRKGKSTTGKGPSQSMQLQAYALYKQSTVGDVQGKGTMSIALFDEHALGSRPWAVNIVQRAKYDAWAAVKSMSQVEAKSKYIEEIAKQAKENSIRCEGKSFEEYVGYTGI